MIVPVPRRQRLTSRKCLLSTACCALDASCHSTVAKEFQGDRFIPVRSAMDLQIAHFNLCFEPKESLRSASMVASAVKEEYRKKLANNLLHNGQRRQGNRILNFKRREGLVLRAEDVPVNKLWAAGDYCTLRQHRHISQSPERILDAPELVDDYYLNLLDWSSTNVLAVALGTIVYLWNAETCAISQLMQANEDDDFVTSVAWAPDGKHIAVGLNLSEVQIWDAVNAAQVRRMSGHSSRVGSLAWNGPLLSSGSRDSQIINHDVRVHEHTVSTFMGHHQEVCGLRWSSSGQQLASGGNDNLLHIWEARCSNYLYRFGEHQAAVKALAWCPLQANILASGGGTADRCIRLWNTQTGMCMKSIDTESQVCALVWGHYQKELLSSHGYSKNQLCLWKYPAMLKIAELTGHSARVLHLAQSPDGLTVVSAAADETLRFWKVFAPSERGPSSAGSFAGKNGFLSLTTGCIR